MQTEEIVFILWYLVSRPFIRIYHYLKILSKPRNVLKLFIVTALGFLFLNNLNGWYNSLKPDFKNPFFYVFTGLIPIVYLWKHGDPENGETWKAEYKTYLKSKEEKKKKKEAEEALNNTLEVIK